MAETPNPPTQAKFIPEKRTSKPKTPPNLEPAPIAKNKAGGKK